MLHLACRASILRGQGQRRVYKAGIYNKSGLQACVALFLILAGHKSDLEDLCWAWCRRRSDFVFSRSTQLGRHK